MVCLVWSILFGRFGLVSLIWKVWFANFANVCVYGISFTFSCFAYFAFPAYFAYSAYSAYFQCPAGRVFQYRVGSGRVLEKIPGSGSGSGRVGVLKYTIGYFQVSFLLSGIY